MFPWRYKKHINTFWQKKSDCHIGRYKVWLMHMSKYELGPNSTQTIKGHQRVLLFQSVQGPFISVPQYLDSEDFSLKSKEKKKKKKSNSLD